MTLIDTSRLCIHTITTKPLPIEITIEQYAARAVGGITVWRQALEGRSPVIVGQQIRDAGLSVVSLCRGGFFPAVDATARQAAIDDNLRAIDEAAELGAPLIVLVCGALPGQLELSRQHIKAGLEAILPHAEANNIKLAVEPLHPMYAAHRSAINTLAQANDLCDEFNSPYIGVALDVYHVWWEPDLEAQIKRCGAANRIFAFHVCDWKTPITDVLNDRGLMGEGCIPVREIRNLVEAQGFSGFIEVEIFSTRHWAQDQAHFLDELVAAYLMHV